MVIHICNPSYLGGGGRRIVFKITWVKLVKPYLKKHMNELGHALSGRVPAQQARDPGFDPWNRRKKDKKETVNRLVEGWSRPWRTEDTDMGGLRVQTSQA
jgi:hypothetical protein